MRLRGNLGSSRGVFFRDRLLGSSHSGRPVVGTFDNWYQRNLEAGETAPTAQNQRKCRLATRRRAATRATTSESASSLRKASAPDLNELAKASAPAVASAMLVLLDVS